MSYERKINEGTSEVTFESKSIPGSPLGLLFFVIPASVWITGILIDHLPSRTTGGAAAAIWFVGSVLLSAVAYLALRRLIFIRTHRVAIQPNVVRFDGTEYPRLGSRFSYQDKDEQAYIFRNDNGRQAKLTGWIPYKDAAAIVSMMNH